MKGAFVQVSEWGGRRLPSDQFEYPDAVYLWRRYEKVIDLQPPSPRTDDQWAFHARQWIGQIPLPSGSTLAIIPRCSVTTLLRMLDSAFRETSIEVPKGTLEVDTLPELFERVVHLLATSVRRRDRLGLYRSYVTRRRVSPTVRGRLDFGSRWFRPPNIALPTTYNEITEDIPDNQVLLHALDVAAKSPSLTSATRTEVRSATRSIRGRVSSLTRPIGSYMPRAYNRLNRDYQPMHSWATMIELGSAPSMSTGREKTVPFLLDMAKLFELFVQRGLFRLLGQSFRLRFNRTSFVGSRGQVLFRPDIQGVGAEDDRVRFVADTKYRFEGLFSSQEISQVVAYALLLGTDQAFLIYPVGSVDGEEAALGPVHIRALSLPLDSDLEKGFEALAGRLSALA